MGSVGSFVRGWVESVAPSRCVACDEASLEPFCPSCRSIAERVPSEEALFRYGGPVADAIGRYKYRGQSELAAPLGRLMADAVKPFAGVVDAVVPVPLHWRRRRSRGFDQAALLARPIAKALGVPARLRGLRRVRHTASQVDLPRDDRLQNVEGAFVCWRLGNATRVLLIDDVRTTGATLRSASDALRMGGVAEVRSFVLATRVLL